MLKMSYAGCPGPSPTISAQLTLKMCVEAGNRKKNSLKTFILRAQSHSRSSMLINLISLSPVLVMIRSMSVLICNRFHTIRANNGKIASFYGGTPLWRPRWRGTPAPRGTKFCHDKLETWRQPTVKIPWS